jgi:hypothetical protein
MALAIFGSNRKMCILGLVWNKTQGDREDRVACNDNSFVRLGRPFLRFCCSGYSKCDENVVQSELERKLLCELSETYLLIPNQRLGAEADG